MGVNNSSHVSVPTVKLKVSLAQKKIIEESPPATYLQKEESCSGLPLTTRIERADKTAYLVRYS